MLGHRGPHLSKEAYFTSIGLNMVSRYTTSKGTMLAGVLLVLIITSALGGLELSAVKV